MGEGMGTQEEHDACGQQHAAPRRTKLAKEQQPRRNNAARSVARKAACVRGMGVGAYGCAGYVRRSIGTGHGPRSSMGLGRKPKCLVLQTIDAFRFNFKFSVRK